MIKHGEYLTYGLNFEDIIVYYSNKTELRYKNKIMFRAYLISLHPEEIKKNRKPYLGVYYVDTDKQRLIVAKIKVIRSLLIKKLRITKL